MPSKAIYFDHSATTPVDPAVLRAMLPYFSNDFGNPSSVHRFGQKAAAAIDRARERAAEFLNAEAGEVVFTSGATEANNLALRGLVEAVRRRQPERKWHVITSVIEHDSVLEPVAALERAGAEVTHLPVDRRGIVAIADLERAIKDDTVLVSLMYVNSEVGSIQPIKEVGKLIKKINDRRLKAWQNAQLATRGDRPQPVYFHTDATQAANFLSCDVQALNLDLLSLSGHKVYGPKGAGLLFVRQGTPLAAQQLGGHHENNRRSGTLNVPGIVGLGQALAAITPAKQAAQNRKIAGLRDQLVRGLETALPAAILNTDRAAATPAHAHFSFPGVEGEAILIALDLAGIAVSTGSACASNSLKASHVLVAMGIKVEVAHSSIRFSLGKHNTASDIKRLVAVLPPIIKRLQRMSPLG